MLQTSTILRLLWSNWGDVCFFPWEQFGLSTNWIKSMCFTLFFKERRDKQMKFWQNGTHLQTERYTHTRRDARILIKARADRQKKKQRTSDRHQLKMCKTFNGTFICIAKRWKQYSPHHTNSLTTEIFLFLSPSMRTCVCVSCVHVHVYVCTCICISVYIYTYTYFKCQVILH